MTILPRQAKFFSFLIESCSQQRADELNKISLGSAKHVCKATRLIAEQGTDIVNTGIDLL